MLRALRGAGVTRWGNDLPPDVRAAVVRRVADDAAALALLDDAPASPAAAHAANAPAGGGRARPETFPGKSISSSMQALLQMGARWRDDFSPEEQLAIIRGAEG